MRPCGDESARIVPRCRQSSRLQNVASFPSFTLGILLTSLLLPLPYSPLVSRISLSSFSSLMPSFLSAPSLSLSGGNDRRCLLAHLFSLARRSFARAPRARPRRLAAARPWPSASSSSSATCRALRERFDLFVGSPLSPLLITVKSSSLVAPCSHPPPVVLEVAAVQCSLLRMIFLLLVCRTATPVRSGWCSRGICLRALAAASSPRC